jgi:UDP-N-acetylmuramoyl-L-alanyl-D-glutamate--2,6-diaminopimelate ligase
VYNALAALTVGLAAGFTLESSVRALGTVPGVPGRFERIDQGQGFLVLVDYAHTPDSLANVIAAAREVTKGRVLVVFGCGGDRDRTKRPVMGRLAAQMADVAILTSDNPRGEDPLEIIAEVEQGMNAAPAAQAQRYSLPDREEAIRLAVDLARPGDVVLIAGKGHETYQVFRDKTIHFDDREVARQALAALGFGGGRRP